MQLTSHYFAHLSSVYNNKEKRKIKSPYTRIYSIIVFISKTYCMQVIFYIRIGIFLIKLKYRELYVFIDMHAINLKMQKIYFWMKNDYKAFCYLSSIYTHSLLQIND